jgi:hypothetical protein
MKHHAGRLKCNFGVTVFLFISHNMLGSSKLLSTCFLAGHPLLLLHLLSFETKE